ncbi:hypothetical protein F2P56_031368 [Juglans regia]|uniref:Cyclic nucleotide-binding domain-containing protein n=1 Tax=Juglans regia TaxID=51240 RepID=A0A833U1D7_JUGRE|nr:hypothetical protein F2P56_031368 [Juglans regia]
MFRYLKFRSELWSLVIDVLAILPVPQVLLPIIFSKLRGSESLNKRKVLTAVVLFQYLPRAIRIYLSSVSWRNAFTHDGGSRDKLSKSAIAVKAGFNLFMFIVASHILGAFWYFFSVEREIACWHLACGNHIECDRSSFYCNHGSFGNYTFLNDHCPIQTPNTTVFDFGIFQGALQSGTVASTDFPRKILYCFWWGLRNLSSFGSNLHTSPNFWENCFSVLTSISGLLLFMYFLGRLQMYMHLAASRKLDEAHQRLKEDKQRQKKTKQRLKEEKQRQKKTKQLEKLKKRWEKEMKVRKLGIRFWIDRQPQLREIRETIINQVDRMFTEEENFIITSVEEENLFAAKYIISRSKYEAIVDAENPLPYLPIFIRRDIQRRLCLPLLRKVPMFREASDTRLQLICQYIKQVYYSEDTYIIREGEPLDRMLFITKGVLWKFATTNNNGVESTVSSSHGECIEEGCYCGKEILNWGFHGFSQQVLPNLSDLPISDKTLKTHTKVEAFALMANDLKALVSRCARPTPTKAVLMIQEAWRRREKVRNWQLRAGNT